MAFEYLVPVTVFNEYLDTVPAIVVQTLPLQEASLAVRGGAAAALTLAGGFWGVLISAGSAAWGVVEHDQDTPALQAQLRENLDASLDILWQDLLEDEQGGVTTVAHHMSTQVENAVFHPADKPLTPYLPEPSGLF